MIVTFLSLTFHSLDGQHSVISFSPRLFRDSMAKLHENGYRTVSLLEAANCLSQRRQFPDRSFVITFDDGYQSVYDEAFPVLQRYGLSATVFLISGRERKVNGRLPSLNGRSMLSWREIREMHQWGIDFGAHTCTHPDLTRLSVDRIETEILNSKAIIEDALSAPVTSFAYPYGRYNKSIRDLVQQNFACACSDKLGLITRGSDLYSLERIDAYYLRTDRLFNMMFTKLFPWYIWARSIPRWIRRTVQNGLR